MSEKNLDLELDDLIVLLLGTPTSSSLKAGRIEGITRLEKLIFLLSKNDNFKNLFDEDPGFYAHNFGPFSSKIYQEIDNLRSASIITDSFKPSDKLDDTWEERELVGFECHEEYFTRNFELTERGSKYYSILKQELPKSLEKNLAEFKEKFAYVPLRKLVRFVYKRYPEYTEKSIIKEKMLG